MSILKTNAVPLYWTDISNTSRIVTWLTAHGGKQSTAIKGDQRRNSRFRGQYDLFSTSELLYYDRADRGLHIAKECCLLTPRTGFRTDWRACAAAGYIAALFAKTTPRDAIQPDRFAFFEEMLGHAETCGHHPAFLIWFDLRFAAFEGQQIQLEETSSGGRRHTKKSGEHSGRPPLPHRFSARHGGLIDAGYAREHRIPAAPLPPDLLALLRSWQTAATPRRVLTTRIDPGQLEQINRLFEQFVAWQFDLPPHVRRTAASILRSPSAA